MSSPKLLFTLDQPHGNGELYFTWQKGESRSYLATTGADATVAIHNRNGELVERIKLPGLCAGMEWDSDGDNLAIISPNSNSILLWESHTNTRLNIETGLKEPPSCIAWACDEPILAIGTHKGNLALYNHHTTKRIPIIGKHNKRITCAAWNRAGVLALAAEDRTLSLSSADGGALRSVALRDAPSDLQFADMKTDERERTTGENTVSLVVGKRILYLYSLLSPDSPVELAFQQRYGHIAAYRWYGDGYILIGFTAGFVVSISTHMKEVGEELFQVRPCGALSDVRVGPTLAAVCGDGQLKLLSVWRGGAEGASLAPPGGADRCAFSADGRLLAAAGRAHLAVYVTQLPDVHAAHGTRIVTLTSLSEATVYQCVEVGDDGVVCKSEPAAVATCALPVEPTHLALGAEHVGCARDAQVFYCPLAGGAARRRAAGGDVTKLVMAGDYAAYMFAGKAVLHLIEEPPPSESERSLATFPPPPHDARLTDIQLTQDFFIYVTDRGDIHHWSLAAWAGTARLRHGGGWAACAADLTGARAAVTDARARSFIYMASGGELLSNPHVLEDCKGFVWDLSERHVLACYGASSVRTLSAAAAGARGGGGVRRCGDTPLAAAATPLLLFAGEVYCAAAGGSVSKLTLNSHTTPALGAAEAGVRAAARRAHAAKLTQLRRYAAAAAVCELLDEEAAWRRLAEAAVDDLNIDFAIRVYTRLSDAAMVWALQDVAHVEELPLLCGLLSAWLSDGETAARWLAAAGGAAGGVVGGAAGGAGAGGAGAAGAAAALARARGDWAAAALAGPAHARDHAQHLELTADYHAALAKYEQALIDNPTTDKDRKHNEACEAGVARTAARCGEHMRCVAVAMKLSHNTTLLRDCAELLEEEKQYLHAATLYEQAGNAEKAASLYIKLKAWPKVEALLPKITSPSVHIQYARAKEAEGRYADALKSYMTAQDFESAIRLNLDKLDDIDEAVALVQETKSVHGAKMVAAYFQNTNDQASAIKFLVMSLCYDEAFALARKLGQLKLYGEILVQTSQARAEDFRSLALHFEGERDGLLAGRYYFHAGDHAKAMGHLLKVAGELEDEAISVAIDAAAASDDERLTRRLIDHLLGEVDGAPREPRHLFRLYMAKKQYDDAAKTAVLIARSLCAGGQYRAARDVLRQAVTAAGRAPPALAPLHRYMLVRAHVRRGRHDLAAQLLTRLAADLDVFPTLAHQVSILTSTVIECGRAGLRHDALHWARALMQPHYRPHIDPKYVTKIESCVRHGVRRGRSPPPAAPCPVCGGAVPRAELRCARCEAVLPFCIATGLHIEKDDLTACPECDFPAIHSEFVELLKDEGKCPMCDEAVDYQRLVKIEDVAPYLHLNSTE